MSTPPPEAAHLARELLRWFPQVARTLPWRAPARQSRRDPYHVLVSETMLQQTQVSRVLEKFSLFLDRFPTLPHLAKASDDDVLAAWTGLGYYRRARMLHAAAKAIVDRHKGIVPSDIPALRALPGVGAYTAGAIASIAYNRPEPIVDTNIARVLLRVHGKQLEAERDRTAFAWQHAAALARATAHPGDCNEAMMELGALVCTAREARCNACPWQARCVAHRDDTIARIPPPKARKPRTPLTHVVFALPDPRRIFLCKRDAKASTAGSLWAGLYQLPTIELPTTTKPSRSKLPRGKPPRTVHEAMALASLATPPMRIVPSPNYVGPVLDFTFQTTHRDVRHIVFVVASIEGQHLSCHSPETALATGMSSPQRRILKELQTLLDANLWQGEHTDTVQQGTMKRPKRKARRETS
jgi:A/G-specific adenine glycosylase